MGSPPILAGLNAGAHGTADFRVSARIVGYGQVVYNTVNFGDYATWNDYGEGTQIEPTVQDGFTDLEEIQKFTGVPYGLSQLELVYDLYQAREEYLNNATEESLLNQASSDINNLDFAPATTIIDQALGIPEPTTLPLLGVVLLLLMQRRWTTLRSR